MRPIILQPGPQAWLSSSILSAYQDRYVARLREDRYAHNVSWVKSRLGRRGSARRGQFDRRLSEVPTDVWRQGQQTSAGHPARGALASGVTTRDIVTSPD